MYRCSVERNQITHNSVLSYTCFFVKLVVWEFLLINDTDQIVVAVVADERPAAVTRAVPSSGVSAGITHQISIRLGKQRGGKHTCH